MPNPGAVGVLVSAALLALLTGCVACGDVSEGRCWGVDLLVSYELTFRPVPQRDLQSTK